MQQIPEIEVSAVPNPLLAELVVLDVREPDEWQAGHIEHAVHIPLGSLPERLGDVPADQQILVVCKVGGRSAQATQFLQAHGREAVNLLGGMMAWESAGRPLVADSGTPFVA